MVQRTRLVVAFWVTVTDASGTCSKEKAHVVLGREVTGIVYNVTRVRFDIRKFQFFFIEHLFSLPLVATTTDFFNKIKKIFKVCFLHV